MGYANDLGTGIVFDSCPLTRYPRDRYGHLLRTTDLHDGSVIPDWHEPGRELPNWTSPYGHLHFCVGTGDDFWCFDYERVNAGAWGEFIVLHAVINSERGSFIMDAPYGYQVLPVNTMKEQSAAVREAFGLVDRALSWVYENDLKHDRRGWNQDPAYFAIAVARSLRGWRFRRKNGTDLPDRAIRMGHKNAYALAFTIAYGEQK